MRRALPFLLGVLLLAGCGSGASVGADLGEAAELAPASAKAFVVVRTDGDAEETRNAVALLERFPAIRGHELDLQEDVLPALGDEAAVVVLGEGSAVLLARPDDRAKFDELLGRAEKDAVTREVEGWTVAAEDEAALDAFEQAREAGTLAEDEAFRSAFDELPGDAVAKAWSSEQGESFPGFTAAAFADDDALRFEGRMRGGPAAEVEPYEPRLLDRVPAGVSLVASFRGQEGLAGQLRSLPIPQGLGLDSLGELLEGEGVLYLRRSALIPEVTLLTEVEDDAEASADVEALLRRLGADVQADADGGGGRVALGPVTVSYGARDGILAVTTAAVEAVLQEPADALEDDPRFSEAAERADLPDETGGFLYLRIDDVLPLLTMLAGSSGEQLPPELRANLEPLRTLFVHAGRDGDGTSFSGFLQLGP